MKQKRCTDLQIPLLKHIKWWWWNDDSGVWSLTEL